MAAQTGFRHPRGLRERILVIGPQGVGKSYAYFRIARMLQLTGSDARMYIVDTDFSFEHMIIDEDFKDLTNVEVREVLTWDEYRDAMRVFRKVIRPQDWLVVDMMSPAWDAVQDYYIEEVFGDDPAEYFVRIRKDMDSEDEEEAKSAKSKRGGFEGRRDWGVINKLYRKHFSTLIASCRGNVFLTSPMDTLSKEDRNDKDLVDLYGKFGVKPKGQKHTGHIVHTLLKFAESRRDGYVMTTIKDRSREQLQGEEIGDFALSYLVKVAGWTIK